MVTSSPPFTSSASSSSPPLRPAAVETTPDRPWFGEPRVIYDDVVSRIEHLKRYRQLKSEAAAAANRAEPSPASAEVRSWTSPAVVKALAASKAGRKILDASPPPSESSNSGQEGRENDRGGRQDPRSTDADGGGGGGGISGGDGSGGKRFVHAMFDPTVYDAPSFSMPRVTAIDNRGEERRVSYRDGQLEALDVGSVVVFAGKFGGSGMAAYYVGEEEYQVLFRFHSLALLVVEEGRRRGGGHRVVSASTGNGNLPFNIHQPPNKHPFNQPLNQQTIQSTNQSTSQPSAMPADHPISQPS